MIKFFDLFAGIGGFRVGLERLGWKCVGFCDNNRYSVRTYKTNFDTTGEFYCYEVSDLNPVHMPDFDCLTAGYPCQSWSIAGNKKGFEDARGTLFYDIIRILGAKKPKYFILENVEGLVCKPFVDREFKWMMKELIGLNYRVYWKLLNAKDYGVPQSRSRIFFVGFYGREGVLIPPFTFPSPVPLTVTLKDVLEKNVSPRYDLKKKGLEALMRHLKRHKDAGHGFGMRKIDPKLDTHANTLSARYYKDGSENLVVTEPMMLTEARTEKAKEIRKEAMKEGRDFCPRREKELVPREDGLGNCVTASPTMEHFVLEPVEPKQSQSQDKCFQFHRGPNAESNVREYEGIAPCVTQMFGIGGNNMPMVFYNAHDVNKEESGRWGDYIKKDQTIAPTLDAEASWGVNLRRLTPRECARLQSFPDSFRIPVSISNVQAYKQFGNAVVPAIVEMIGRNMMKHIDAMERYNNA